MAKSYTSTIQLKARKQHTCAGCGGVFSYALARKIVGSARTADKASANAKALYAKALQFDVDPHPCPTCGLYQADMIGQKRTKRLRIVFWFALIAFIVTVILRATDTLQSDVVTWTVTGICAAAALIMGAIDRSNPNADPDSNKHVATDRLAAAVLTAHAPGRIGAPAEALINPPRALPHLVSVPLLVIAVAVAAAPEVNRRVHHWPLNPACYPPVVGPGDKTRYYLTSEITSVKGYWRGIPLVTLTPEGELNLITPEVKTNDNSWGSSISVKSGEKSTKVHPWIEMTVPATPSLAGKKVLASVRLDLSYPQVYDSSNFATKHSAMDESTDIQLAPPSAGSQYNAFWWVATGTAAVLTTVCGLILISAAKRLSASASPTRILETPPPLPSV